MKATPKLKELLYLTKEWFLARHVEQGSPDKQILKLFEEGGELSSGFLKNKKDLTKDSIGDATVVLIGLSLSISKSHREKQTTGQADSRLDIEDRSYRVWD